MESPARSGILVSLASSRWFAPMLAGIVLLTAIWVMTRAWDASLLDRYQFRQTQTALTTHWMQKEGFRLDYSMPVFGPPWSAPMEFPLYQWLVARVSRAAGISLVPAARLVGIFFFLATLPAVFGLARGIEPDFRRRLLIPAAVLTAPVCLFYSRAFMIESCAAALAVWFLYAYVRSLGRADWRWTAATLVTGVLAGLVKITTFALFGLPAVAYTLYLLVRETRSRPATDSARAIRRIAVAAVVPALPILAAAAWWVSFSDAIKGSNPIAVMLTSHNLSAWHFGTLVQRLDPVVWKNVAHQWSIGAVSPWATFLLTGALLVIAAPYRRAALLCTAGFLVGPLVFANLFAIHEYYYFPAALFAAAAAGIVLAGLMATSRIPASAKAVILGAFFALQALSFNADYAATLKHLPAPPPPVIEVVARATAETGVILVYGWDWNALIPYYADRRAILMPPSRENQPAVLLEILGRLPKGQVAALVLQGEHKRDAAFIKWCTSLLNLSSNPVARSPDGDVYVPTSRIPALKTELADRADSYPGVVFDFANPSERPDPRLLFQKPVAADFAPVASPAPFALYNPWGIQVAPIAGQPGISANAPSELHFHAPAGATRIEASFGIVEGAYTAPNSTDGIDVVIFELLPAGGRRILFQRFLNPVHVPTDRGLQTITLDHLAPLAGPVVFGLYPGPVDNIAFDWGYWRKITIQ